MKSIFTSDFDTCAVTHIHKGARRIEVHHCLYGPYRTKATFYGYVIPLIAEIHPNGAAANDKECQKLTGMTLKELDTKLKQKCQEHYENVLGKSREQFIEEFGKNYL